MEGKQTVELTVTFNKEEIKELKAMIGPTSEKDRKVNWGISGRQSDILSDLYGYLHNIID